MNRTKFRKNPIFGIFIGMLIFGAVVSSSAGVSINIESEYSACETIINLQLLDDDPHIVEFFTPPYDDEKDQGGIWSWVHADKDTGGLAGFAMAQWDLPHSSADGWIAKIWDLYDVYEDIHRCYKISEIAFHFTDFYAHIGGNLLWTHGGCTIRLSWELYRDGAQVDSGTIWEKHADAFPNYFWEEDDPQTFSINTNKEFNWYDNDDAEIRVIGYVFASRGDGDGYCSCEFDVTLGYIKVWGYQPDLIVTDIWTDPPKYKPGQNIKICAEIKNVGDYKAVLGGGSIYVTFYKDEQQWGAPVPFETGVFEVDETESGSTYRDWPNDQDRHAIKAFVDKDDFVEESNENNNDRTEHFSAPRNRKCVNLLYNKQLANSSYLKTYGNILRTVFLHLK